MSRFAGADAGAGRGGVVLALQGSDEPRASLERAHRLARTLEERLSIVRVLPTESRFRSVVRACLGSREATVSPRDAYKATRRWLLRCLGTPAKAIRVVVVGGEFVAAAAACARHTRARLMVISDSPRAGHQAMALVRASGAQVLIARGEAGSSPILAATDLQDPAFPVLRSAAEVARLFQQPMIALHNADPLSVMSGRAVTSTGVMLTGGVPKATRRESLVSVSRSLEVEPNPVLRTELDPAHAILDEAEACDASIIVVGARSCPWWRRLTSEHVSVRVASQADRAVLITPIS